MNLTPRQIEVVNALRNYRHLHGFAPTLQELADTLGVSKVTVFEHVNTLEAKRVLRRDKHKARSLEIVGRLPEEDAHDTLKRLEGMLEQHDSYELGDELSLGRREPTRWFVYLDGKEIHFLASRGEPKPFPDVLGAVKYLESAKGRAVVEKARVRGAAEAAGE